MGSCRGAGAGFGAHGVGQKQSRLDEERSVEQSHAGDLARGGEVSVEAEVDVVGRVHAEAEAEEQQQEQEQEQEQEKV